MNNLDSYIIEITNELPNTIAETIEAGHVEYELKHDVTCNYKKFSLVLKNNEGKFIGAHVAESFYQEVYIDDLWIDQQYRGLGLGRKLLQTLEEHFKNKNYNNINLVTNQFQAPEFYKKCGFDVEFIRIND